MALSAYETDLESLPELDQEYEEEYEGDLEADFESEEFFRSLAGLARQAVKSPALRQLGMRAARMAISGGGGLAGQYLGKRLGGRTGQALGGGLGYGLGTYLGSALAESELDGEYEGETDGELNPVGRVNPDVLMEHLGHAAKDAESEEEAEAFLGALIPLAARLIPRAAPAVMRLAPQLIRGVAGIARTLRSNSVTQPLIRTVPSIVRNTAADIARQVSRGQSITAQSAGRTLARNTAKMLSSPQRCAQCWQRSRALDRQYHRNQGAARAGV